MIPGVQGGEGLDPAEPAAPPPPGAWHFLSQGHPPLPIPALTSLYRFPLRDSKGRPAPQGPLEWWDLRYVSPGESVPQTWS